MTICRPITSGVPGFEPRTKKVMTRGKDDEKVLYDLLGNKDARKKLDTYFKKAESNFKIAFRVAITSPSKSS